MPQLDKVTFLPILFWTLTLYVGGFLLLNTAPLYTFLATIKLSVGRGVRKYAAITTARRFLTTTLLFPWISL